MKPMALLFVLTLTAAGAQAEDLHLSGERRWAVLANSPGRDEAIGIADYLGKAKVVETASGGFAVVAGPFDSEKAAARANLPQKPIAFTTGSAFARIAWEQQEAPVLAHAEMDRGTPAEVRHGTLLVKLSTTEKAQSGKIPVVTGFVKGQKVFEMAFDDSADEEPSVTVELIQGEAGAPFPLVLATSFTGGAHCCYDTRLATAAPNGEWSLIRHQMIDGAPPSFTLIDGRPYLVHADQAFNYAYASYAESVAPPRIFAPAGKTLDDVTFAPAFISFHRQKLAGLDYAARQDPSLRQSFGFLGGWYALKVLARQGEEGLKTLKDGHDRFSGWNDERCLDTGVALERCAPKHKVRLKFPDLVQFDLRKLGYPIP